MLTVRSSFKGRRALVTLCLGLGFSVSQGCARSEHMHPATSNSLGAAQPLPFHPESGLSNRGGSPVATETDTPKVVPFRATNGPVLPAGTLLTVELENSLSPTRVHSGDMFKAVVAAPLVVKGNTLIDRGVRVTGLVEAAEARSGAAYVRLTLSTLDVEGTPLTVQTSSLFAGGSAKEFNDSTGNLSRQSGAARIRKGHRLTFRLTAPLSLAESFAQDRRKPQAVGTR